MRHHILPRMEYQLVMNDCTSQLLTSIDRRIREAVRLWLRLPHDTPMAFFHASVRDGGLGVPEVRFSAPLRRLRRLERLQDSLSTVVRLVSSTPSTQASIQRLQRLLKVGSVHLDSRAAIEEHYRRALYGTYSGRPLMECGKVSESNSWILDYGQMIDGRQYIDLVKCRISALPTRARCSRGRAHKDARCRRGCHSRETLTHVSQRCPATHASRIKRHDGIVRFLAGRLQRRGYSVKVEPRLTCEQQVYKPDLILRKDGKAIVLDAQVVGPNIELDKAYDTKRKKYATAGLRRVIEADGSKLTRIGAATVSFVGVISQKSSALLKELGLTGGDLRLISIRAVQGTVGCFQQHSWST
jgi:hypothetical protein